MFVYLFMVNDFVTVTIFSGQNSFLVSLIVTEDVSSFQNVASDSDSEVYCDSVDQFGAEEVRFSQVKICQTDTSCPIKKIRFRNHYYKHRFGSMGKIKTRFT